MGTLDKEAIARKMAEQAEVVDVALTFNTRTGEFHMKGPLENPPVVFGMLAMAQAQMTSMWVERSSKARGNSTTKLSAL